MVVSQKHKDFIEAKLKKLEAYDTLRPEGHVYEFHLHSRRVAESMKTLAKTMGYKDTMQNALYWATLPHDIGKMALPVHLWDSGKKPSDKIKDERRAHTTQGVDMVRAEFGDECASAPFLKLMIDIMENHHEHCNGTGYLGKTATDLSQEVRMACICDAFDGYSTYRAHFGDRDISPKAVIHRMQVEKSGQFDEEILKSFKETMKCQLKPSLSQP